MVAVIAVNSSTWEAGSDKAFELVTKQQTIGRFFSLPILGATLPA
jgi:hypothetical protein